MARITVEDCIKQVKNQYDLVILAKERTVQLGRGAAPAVDPENDKKPVIALREIGETKITPEELRESIVNKLRLIPDYQEEEELEEVDNDTFRQMYQGGLLKSEMEKSATRKFTARVPRIESKPVKQVEETNIEAESDVTASIEEAVESETNIEEQQEDIISVEESSKESDDNAIPANLDPIEESQLSEDISETLSSEEISVEDESTKED